MHIIDKNDFFDLRDRDSMQAELDDIVSRNCVVLFMKGNRKFPICGLSSDVCFMMRRCNLDFTTVDLLTKPGLYLFMKVLHDPISAPYLYAGGKFIGGYETIRTMFNNGLLNQIIQNKKIEGPTFHRT